MFKYIFTSIFFVLSFLPAVLSAQEQHTVSTSIRDSLSEYEKIGVEVGASTLYPERVFEFEIKDMPIQDAMTLLKQKSGRVVVVDSDIDINVTLFLRDMKAEDILRILVDNYNLAYIEEDGMHTITTKKAFKEKYGYAYGEKIKTKMITLLHAEYHDVIDVLNQMKSDNGRVLFNEDTTTFILIDEPDKIENMTTYIKKIDVPIETKEFILLHTTPGKVIDQIKPLLTLNVGEVKVNNDKVAVTDTLYKLVEIDRLIQELDQAEKQIRIRGKIIQIVLNDEHVKGVDWEAIVSDFKRSSFLGMKNAIEGKNRKISWGHVSDEDYKVLLDALDTVGDISEVHEEEFVSLKNMEHDLVVRPLKVISLIPEEKAYVDRNGHEADVIFHIKPVDQKDNKIDVVMQPEVFSLKEDSVTMSVNNGATIVVGGLFKEVTVEIERKIPLLGDIPIIRNVPFEDIPILGFAFRNSKRRERLTEIIIFLSVETVSAE